MDRPCQNCQKYFDIREHKGKCPYCNFNNFNQSTCTNNVSIKTEKIDTCLSVKFANSHLLK